MPSRARRPDRRSRRAARPQHHTPPPPVRSDTRVLAWTVALTGGVLVASAAPAAGQITGCNVNSPTTNSTTYDVGTGQSCATLTINNTTLSQTASAVLKALSGGVIALNGGTISGGTLSTSGTGTITATNNGNNFLVGVTLGGTLDLASSQSLVRLQSGLTFGSGGTINLDNNSILAVEGSQTLGGTGTIVFGAAGSGNRLTIESPGGGTGTLTVGSGVTIHGQNGSIGGQVFEGGSNALVNNGTIRADVAGGTIAIVNAAVTNNNVLAATSGGTLALQSAVTNGTSGRITATDGGIVYQNGTSITGGTINTTGGTTAGLFRASNDGNNFLNGVTVTGTVDLATNQSLVRVGGGGLTVTSGSTINVNNNSILAIEGNQTLGGSGAITFGNTGSGNRLTIESPGGSTGTLTIGSSFTIHGQNGTIGQQVFEGGANAIVNNGTISADVAGGTITIVNAPVTNTGTLQAQNGGTLVLQSNVASTGSGQVLAGNGSVVYQNGVTVAGQVNTSGTGVFQAANNGSNFWNAVTLNGTADFASNQSLERVQNNLTLQKGAAININNNSVFAIEGTQTLGGSGAITFGSTGSGNRLTIESPGSVTGTLTVGSGVTIHGQNGSIGGQVFEGGSNALVNNGTITADVSGGTITIVNAPVTNTGTLSAQNGGTLVLQSNVASTGSGQVLAGNASLVVQNGVTVSGQVNTSGTGVIQAANNGSNYFSNVTLHGTLDLASNQSLERIQNNLTLQTGSAINVNNNSILAVEGSQTIGGSGAITFGSTGSGNRLTIESPGGGTGTLTVGSGVTIHGINGTIGQQVFEGGPNAIVNAGTINSDGGGTITITNAPVTNNGTLRAQNGTLQLNTPLSGAGTLQVDAAGVVNLAAGQSNATQGTLAIGGTGATLNNGTTNVTLSADYTNASAGVGNAFNRHAGVTGSGLILAGGDVSQAITGANVTNGTSNTNATLTIGNVRVGANAITYNIAANGTSGPALRGAIQTNVNGANITDSRLSVTPTNYGPIAVGSSEAHTVTFTAASAGALAPMTGQVLNLNSTYDNIGDASGNQKLHIVLGSGAAAYQTAQGRLNTAPLNFGVVQVGQAVSQTLSITNSATGPSGYVEDLNARFGSATDSRISGTGTITGLTAGSTNSSSMVVTVNTSNAGTVDGSIRVNYFSAGTVRGVSNGLGELGVGGTDYGVTGTIQTSGKVVNQADPVINNNPVNLGATRVGGAALSGTISVTNRATTAPQAALDASVGGTSGGVTGSGSFTLLNPGSTDNTSLHVGIGAGTAGTYSGTATVTFVSDATNQGCTSNCKLTLASQNVTVNGKVYTPAVARLNTTGPIDFGIVHVGDNVSRTLSVTNAATPTALNDVLTGGVSTTSPGFSASGSLAGVAAGATDNSSLSVRLNTASSGRFSGSAAVAFASHDADLADLSLGSQSVTLSGQVNNYAQGDFSKTSGMGMFSEQDAHDFTLDFGHVLPGSSSESANLAVDNVARGFADLLNGSFSVMGSGFLLGGFNPFANLAAGESLGGFSVTFDPGTTVGSFSEVVTLDGYGTNASGYSSSANVAPVHLTIRGSVGTTVTPEPGTWALVAAGLAGVGLAAHRRRRTAEVA